MGRKIHPQLLEPPKILPKNVPGNVPNSGKQPKNKTLTVQGINISHLGKRKIIFKMPFLGDMLVSWRVRKKMLLLGFSVDGEHSAPETRVRKGGVSRHKGGDPPRERENTYPTFGKFEKSSTQMCRLVRDLLVSYKGKL